MEEVSARPTYTTPRENEEVSALRLCEDPYMDPWYSLFVQDMVNLRQRLKLTRSGAAERIGVSLKVLEHWEKQHNRAKPHHFKKWAAAYGYRLSISWAPEETPIPDADFLAVIAKLPAADRPLMLRFMQAYTAADKRGRLYLIGAIGAEEAASTEDTSTPAPAQAIKTR